MTNTVTRPIQQGISALFKDRAPGLLVLLSLALLSLAYQVRRPYRIEIGHNLDRAFVSGFNSPERHGSIMFRWTTASSRLFFPGLGRGAIKDLVLRLNGYRPDGDPAEVTLFVNGQPVPGLKTANDFGTDRFDVSNLATRSADLEIRIQSDTFSTPEDARQLGIMLAVVRLVPERSGIVTPDWDQVAQLTLGVLSAYVLLLALRFSRRVALAAAVILLLAIAVVLGWFRLWLTPVTSSLLIDLWIAGVLAVASFYLLRALWVNPARPPALTDDRTLGRLALIFAFGVWFAFAGLTHPDFFPVDQVFRAHIMSEFILGLPRAERFYFTQPQSDMFGGGFVIPYPPAFDVLFSPVRAAVGTDGLVPALELIAAVLFAACIFPLFFAAQKIVPSAPRVGLFAAVAYIVMPLNSLPLSDGAFPNLLGQFLGLIFVAALAKHYLRIDRPRIFVCCTLLLGFAVIAYPATLLFYSFLLALLIGVRWRLDRNERGRLKRLALMLVAALGSALLVYYWRFVTVILLETLPRMLQTLAATGQVGRSPFMAGTWILPAELTADFRVFPFLAALVALWLTRPFNSAARWIFAMAFLALIPSLVLENWVNLYSKHMIAILPFVALGTGICCAAVWSRSRVGRGLTIGALGYLAASGLTVWLNRVFFYILPPGSGLEHFTGH